MAFYTYIKFYAPKQTQLSWVWDLLVITNSSQISCEYEISGLSLSLSLSLRFVSNHQLDSNLLWVWNLRPESESEPGSEIC